MHSTTIENQNSSHLNLHFQKNSTKAGDKANSLYRWIIASVSVHILLMLIMNLSLLDWKLNSPRLDTIEISLLENSPGPSVAPLRSPGSSTKVKKVVDRDKSYPPQLTPTERASESKQSNRDALTETSKSPAASGLNVSSKKVNDIRSLYIANLVRQIEANKIYPHMAKKLRQSGKVVVMLEILKNGNITAKTIIEECPHKLLNEAALRLVANLKSTSPIPDELQLDSWQVIIPIAYVLR